MDEKMRKQGMRHGFQIILVGPQHIEFLRIKTKRIIGRNYQQSYLQ